MPKDALPVYNPRWLYRFFAFLERLPVRPLTLAALIVLGTAIITHFIAWSRGVVSAGKFDLILATMGFYLVMLPGLWHFLTLRARPSIYDFFKGRGLRPAQIEALLADFVSLSPFWGTTIFIVGGVIGYFANLNVLVPIMPASAQVVLDLSLFSSVLGGSFLFLHVARIVRQSLLTRRFYREIEVDLFNQSPLYALSRYAVTSIITLLLGTYLLQIVSLPSLLFTPLGLLWQIIINTVVFLLFLAQLVGINQRLRRAKERLLSELNKDIQGVYNDVHKAVSKKAYASVARMQASVATLKNEQEILQKIPTWPWQPETLRNLLAPMLLPIIVYLLQRFFGSALGF